FHTGTGSSVTCSIQLRRAIFSLGQWPPTKTRHRRKVQPGVRKPRKAGNDAAATRQFAKKLIPLQPKLHTDQNRGSTNGAGNNRAVAGDQGRSQRLRIAIY